jgi:hypothetical protein
MEFFFLSPGVMKQQFFKRNFILFAVLMENTTFVEDIIFVGTGPSTGVPRLPCLAQVTLFNLAIIHLKQGSCTVCTDAITIDRYNNIYHLSPISISARTDVEILQYYSEHL